MRPGVGGPRPRHRRSIGGAARRPEWPTVREVVAEPPQAATAPATLSNGIVDGQEFGPGGVPIEFVEGRPFGEDTPAAADPKRKKKVKKASPPRGFVHYDEETFDRLQEAKPEPLESSFTMTPGMLMQLLDRPGDAWAHGRSLLLDNHEPRARQRRHVRKTINLFKGLRTAGVVRRLDGDEVGHAVVDQ